MFLLKVIVSQLSLFLLENILEDHDLDPATFTEEQKENMNELDKSIIFNTHKTYSETKAKLLAEVGRETIEEILKEKKDAVIDAAIDAVVDAVTGVADVTSTTE